MKVKVEDLRKLYAARVNDTDILTLDGIDFVPGYLKYMLEYVDSIGASEIDFTNTEGTL